MKVERWLFGLMVLLGCSLEGSDKGDLLRLQPQPGAQYETKISQYNSINKKTKTKVLISNILSVHGKEIQIQFKNTTDGQINNLILGQDGSIKDSALRDYVGAGNVGTVWIQMLPEITDKKKEAAEMIARLIGSVAATGSLIFDKRAELHWMAFPSKKIKNGDRWTQKIPSPLFMGYTNQKNLPNMTLEVQCIKKEGSHVVLDTIGKDTINGQQVSDLTGINMFAYISPITAEIQAQEVFDMDSGMLLKSDMKVKIGVGYPKDSDGSLLDFYQTTTKEVKRIH